MKKRAVTLADLPKQLREIAEVVGIKSALEFAAACGGSHVSVPKSPTPGSIVVKAIGLDAARKLAREYGGTSIDLPVAGKAVTRWMNAVGYTNNEIARLMHVSRRTVANRLNDNYDQEQLELFKAGQ